MENQTEKNMAQRAYSPAQVDNIWAIWGSYYNIPKAIFYLLKGDYRVSGLAAACKLKKARLVLVESKLWAFVKELDLSKLPEYGDIA